MTYAHKHTMQKLIEMIPFVNKNKFQETSSEILIAIYTSNIINPELVTEYDHQDIK